LLVSVLPGVTPEKSCGASGEGLSRLRASASISSFAAIWASARQSGAGVGVMLEEAGSDCRSSSVSVSGVGSEFGSGAGLVAADAFGAAGRAARAVTGGLFSVARGEREFPTVM
jgi:hypothetical protein